LAFFVLSLLGAVIIAGDHVQRIDSRQPGGLSVILGGERLLCPAVAFGLVTGACLPGGELPGGTDRCSASTDPDRKAYWALLLSIVILVVLTPSPSWAG
jgi:hypothetical protein